MVSCRYLTQAAQLIAPLLQPDSLAQGFAWCLSAAQQAGLALAVDPLQRAQAASLLVNGQVAEAATLLQVRLCL